MNGEKNGSIDIEKCITYHSPLPGVKESEERKRKSAMHLYDAIRRYSMLLYVILYGMHLLTGSALSSLASQIALLFTILITFPSLRRTNLIISITITAAALLLLITTGVPIENWLTAFSQNGAVAAIFITVPMLSIPLTFSNYHEDLRTFIQRYVSSPWVFCGITWVFTHLFGVVILIGVVPLMFNLLYENSKLYGADREFISSIIHAQLSGGFWSPAWSAIVVLTYTLSIPWVRFVPNGLILTGIFFTGSMLWIYHSLKRSGAHRIERNTEVIVHWKGVIMTISLTLAPIILILVATSVMNITISAAIPLIALIYPLAAAALLTQWKGYGEGMKQYHDVRILNVKN